MKISVESITVKMRNDPKYLRLKKAYKENSVFRIPVDELQTEIERIHKTRKVRRLDVDDPSFLDKLIGAATQEIGNRSRLVEISIQVVKAVDILQEGCDSLQDYLLVEYAAYLQPFKTKEERINIVSAAIRPFRIFIQKASVLRTQCDMVVKDIDQGGYALRLMVDAYRVHRAPERNI